MGTVARTNLRTLSLLLISSLAAADRCVLFLKHNASATAALLAELESRSDPASSDYLVWLSREEVAAMLQPDKDNLEAAVDLTKRHSAFAFTWIGSDKLEVQQTASLL
jgi:hypothetical protein